MIALSRCSSSRAVKRKRIRHMFSTVRMSVVYALTLIALLAPAHVLGQTPDSSWERHLDALIEKGMQEYHVPGLAVGIVLDGNLVYARGFGHLTLGEPSSVTPDTLFH